MLLLMYRMITIGAIITAVGLFLLILKRHYSWTIICGIALGVILYWMHEVPDSPQPPYFLLYFLGLTILLEDWVYIFRIKRRLKRVLKNMEMEAARFEILPYKVGEYTQNQYTLQRPVMVEIHKEKDIIKAYADLKTDEIIIEKPVLFPIYTRFPERKWKEVVAVHSDGAPKKTEFRDKFGTLVEVGVYDVTGSKTKESWRLNRSLYETWDPVKREWEPQPRGWNP